MCSTDQVNIMTYHTLFDNLRVVIKQSSGDSGANVKRLEQETDEKIQHLKSQAANISHDVAQMLLKHVTTVKN